MILIILLFLAKNTYGFGLYKSPSGVSFRVDKGLLRRLGVKFNIAFEVLAKYLRGLTGLPVFSLGGSNTVANSVEYNKSSFQF